MVEDIKKIIEGEVSQEENILNEFGLDASIFYIKPETVVFPKNSHDIQTLVMYTKAKKMAGENVSLTVRAAGTDMSGAPLTESIALGITKHLNKIKNIDSDSVVLEPGVYFRDLEKELDKRDLIFPSYPASKHMCAIGGMLANNAGGEKTLLFGKTDRYVEELKVVLSDGKEYSFKELSLEELDKKLKIDGFEGDIYRKVYKLLEDNYEDVQAAKPAVSKNSAGYALWNIWDKNKFNLNKLFVGSQGTLGIITEAKLKLLKKRNHSRLAVIFLKDIKLITSLVPQLMRFKPESIESYDRHTLKLALKFLPDLLKVLKNETLFSLGWSFLPEFWMILKGGLPNLVVLAELTGETEEEVEGMAQKLLKELKLTSGVQAKITKSQRETDKYWSIRRESFNLLRKRIKEKQTAPFIDDIIVRPERLPEFLPRLTKILDQYSHVFKYTIAGHVGDGNFHIIPLMNLDDEEARKLIPILSDEVYDLVIEFKGSITAEHNDGLIRSPYLQKMYGKKIYGLFEDIKHIFDPQNIFNPGKKVNSDLKYAFAHIKHPHELEMIAAKSKK